MLNLNAMPTQLKPSMLTTLDSITGFEIVKVLGTVESVVEGGFPIIAIAHLELDKGGGLGELVEKAKGQLAKYAFEMGADAVVGLRYEVFGRKTEKSALAYGTAVKCRAKSADPS